MIAKIKTFPLAWVVVEEDPNHLIPTTTIAKRREKKKENPRRKHLNKMKQNAHACFCGFYFVKLLQWYLGFAPHYYLVWVPLVIIFSFIPHMHGPSEGVLNMCNTRSKRGQVDWWGHVNTSIKYLLLQHYRDQMSQHISLSPDSH